MHGFGAIMAALALAQSEPPASPSVPAADSAPEAAAVHPSPRPSPSTPSAGETAKSGRAVAPAAEPERTQVARTALAFLDALVGRDADGLAALSTERFSFDGDVRTGRDVVRATWRGILSGRAERGALLDLEILPAADAVARLGPPPARVAPLAARGGWVAIADVSGRAVILFLVREGGRWAVAGMHD